MRNIIEESPIGTCTWKVVKGHTNDLVISPGLEKDRGFITNDKYYWPWAGSADIIERVIIKGTVAVYGSAGGMFRDMRNCRAFIIAGLDMSNVEDTSHMFDFCTALRSVSFAKDWDMSNVKTMDCMFGRCMNLTDISSLRNWNTKKVEKMNWMFAQCVRLQDFSPLEGWDTGNVKQMAGTFYKCRGLASLQPFSRWNTSHAECMNLLFMYCGKIKNVEPLKLWKTNNVKDMDCMFGKCTALTVLKGLQRWDTSNLASATSMFNGCTSLKDISALGRWDVRNLTNMNSMFCGCTGLADITPLGKWKTDIMDTCICTLQKHWTGKDTKTVYVMDYMFSGCPSLKDISPLRKWGLDIIKAQIIADGMFKGCAVPDQGRVICSGLTGTVIWAILENKYEDGLHCSYYNTLKIMPLDGNEGVMEDIPDLWREWSRKIDSISVEGRIKASGGIKDALKSMACFSTFGISGLDTGDAADSDTAFEAGGAKDRASSGTDAGQAEIKVSLSAKGGFHAWMPCETQEGTPVLARLFIPGDTKWSPLPEFGYRTEKAEITGFYSLRGNLLDGVREAYGFCGGKPYKAGSRVEDGEYSRQDRCRPSEIQFFPKRKEAVRYCCFQVMASEDE